jgi:hypothetical protein
MWVIRVFIVRQSCAKDEGEERYSIDLVYAREDAVENRVDSPKIGRPKLV